MIRSDMVGIEEIRREVVLYQKKRKERREVVRIRVIHGTEENNVRGKEASLNLTRQSFVSVISEESETFYKDPLKADTCSAAAPLFTENNFSEVEDMKKNIRKRSYSSLPSPSTSTARARGRPITASPSPIAARGRGRPATTSPSTSVARGRGRCATTPRVVSSLEIPAPIPHASPQPEVPPPIPIASPQSEVPPPMVDISPQPEVPSPTPPSQPSPFTPPMHPETPLYPPTSSTALTVPMDPPSIEPMTMIPTPGLYIEHHYPPTSSSSDLLGPPVGIDPLQPDIDVPDEHPPHQPSPPRGRPQRARRAPTCGTGGHKIGHKGNSMVQQAFSDRERGRGYIVPDDVYEDFSSSLHGL
ncbi:hypothetical protein CFP56_013837 [Quercus suber]|uniref:Uncharacterized protein n=1 Tax=Quercus suber TaxID=58331 RepID=A0AAW0M3X3_QUESU